MRASRLSVSLVVAALATALPALAGSRLEKELPLEPGGRLEVAAAAGPIVVRGTDREGARIVVTSKSDDLERDWNLRFEGSAGTVRVVSERKESGWTGWFTPGPPKPNFEIEVPSRTALVVDTRGGSVRVSGTEGDVRVDTSGGSITVEDVRGNASLDTSGGGIAVARLDGALSADTSGGSIRVRGVTGDANLDTSGGSIAVTGAGGRVDADTSGGSIVVEFDRGNGKGGTLETMGGSIRIAVDPSVALEIDASTMGGTVSTGLSLATRGSPKRNSLKGALNGGGEALSASTMGGSIRIDALE